MKSVSLPGVFVRPFRIGVCCRSRSPGLRSKDGPSRCGVGSRLRDGCPAPRSRGFTLLETLVALVVFTGTAMALYGLFNTNLTALARAHDISRQVPAVRRAIEYLSSINPREEGDGRIAFDGLDLVWNARLLQPVRQSQTATGGRGYYEVGLYEIEFAMSDRGRSLGTWRIRAVGYEKVREAEL